MIVNRSSYLLTFLVVATAGCSSGPRGPYTDESGMFTYDFKSGDKVEITTNVMGMKNVAELDYKYEDDKVKIGTEGAMQVMAVDDKGCIDAGMAKLCKADK